MRKNALGQVCFVWRIATMSRRHVWHTPIYFSRMLHGRGVCRLASPVAVAAAVTATGDLVCQCCLEASAAIDRRRLAVAGCLGALLDGAALQRWYAVLHSRMPGTVAQRLLLHHAAFAPALIAVFMAATTATLSQPERVWPKLRHDWMPAVGAQWVIVAPSQAAVAWLVPRHYQVLVVNSCALLWAAALSRVCHRPLPSTSTPGRVAL